MKSTLCIALCFLGAPAFADEPASTREKFFAIDKQAALAEFTDSQRSVCMEAFHGRYRDLFTVDGELAFSEPLSETMYDQLYWNGDSNIRRGVAFTAPLSKGDRQATLVCYYAVTDNHLAFQDAFVLPVDDASLASR